MATPSPFELQSNIGDSFAKLPANDPRLQRLAQLRAAQKASMEQHQQYGQMLQQKQQQVNMRAGDLDVSDRLLKILDPNVNKAARQFLFNELSKNLGVDPKNAAEVQKMVTALDPGTLQGLKTVFMQQMEGAEPGQVSQMAKGILTGEVPMNNLINEATQIARSNALTAQPQDTAQGGAPASSAAAGGAGQPTGGGRPLGPQPAGSAPPAVMSFEEQRTIPPEAKGVSPQLLKELGLGTSTELRNRDLTSQGYAIPLDDKQQTELAGTLRIRNSNMGQVLKGSTDLMRGMRTMGTSEPFGQVAQQVSGYLSTTRPGFVNESGPGSNGWEGIDMLATQKARALTGGAPDKEQNVKNTLLNLSYRMAQTGSVPGNKLTNGVIAENLNQMNSWQDMYTATKDSISKSLQEYDQFVRSNTGRSGYEVLIQSAPDKAQFISDAAQSAEVLPDDFKSVVIDYGERLKTGQPIGPSVQPASPTMQEERQTLGTLELQKKEGQIAETQQQIGLREKTDARAEASGKREQERLDMANSREERMTKAQEGAQQLEREKFDFSKQKANESQQLEKQKFEWQKQKYEEQKSEQHKERIAKAFQAFGAAIGNSWKGVSIGGGGGGGGQGGQDAGAFRLTPGPQRQAPHAATYQVPAAFLYGRAGGG